MTPGRGIRSLRAAVAIFLVAACACARGPAVHPVPRAAERCPDARAVSDEERAALRAQRLPPTKKAFRYLRTCEEFPRPAKLAPGAFIRGYFTICVHPEGFVYDVIVVEPTRDATLNEQFVQAARRWRYQPLMAEGRAWPFCHPLTLEYSRGGTDF